MTEFKDNRYHIECDPSQLQTWELMEIEKLSVSSILLVLCRYVANGDGAVDKELPEKRPLRRMSNEDKDALMDGKGYMWLEELPVTQLQNVARTFVDGATESLEKKA